MAAKKVEDINYKAIFTSAAISAVASAVTIGLINVIFKNNSSSGMGVPMKVFTQLPPKEQARFADETTIKNASNVKWLVEQMANIEVNNPEIYQNPTAKNLANMAFIGLYGKHDDSRLKALQILNNFKNIA